MQWRAAMDYAAREKAKLPSKEQLNAMYEARNTGAPNGTFNITGSLPPAGTGPPRRTATAARVATSSIRAAIFAGSLL